MGHPVEVVSREKCHPQEGVTPGKMLWLNRSVRNKMSSTYMNLSLDNSHRQSPMLYNSFQCIIVDSECKLYTWVRRSSTL